MPATEQAGKPLEVFVQREKKLQRWVWVSTLLPLALFVVLLLMAGKELRKLGELERENAEQTEKIKKNAATIAQQEKELQANNIALSAFKSQRSGPIPAITYYRLSLGPQLEEALKQLGFSPPVAVKENQANQTLLDKPVDTLAYGCAVREEDIRIITAALIKAGIPIRRIEPAKNPNPLLIQLIASAKTDSSQSQIDPANWKKKTPGC